LSIHSPPYHRTDIISVNPGRQFLHVQQVHTFIHLAWRLDPD
jgi:hypothetical protein